MTELHTVVRRVRRGWLRHRRLIAAALAAGAALCLVRVVAPPQPALDPVVVAAHDLPGGAVIGTGDVRTVEMPPDVVPEGAFKATAAAVGASVAAPMRAGEPLTDRRVLGDSLIAGYPAGSEAVPVRIEDAEVVALLRPGDRIDLYASTGDQGSATRIVTDAIVVMLPEVTDDRGSGALIVLAVDELEAIKVASASATGVLTVSLRG